MADRPRNIDTSVRQRLLNLAHTRDRSREVLLMRNALKHHLNLIERSRPLKTKGAFDRAKALCSIEAVVLEGLNSPKRLASATAGRPSGPEFLRPTPPEATFVN